MPDIHGLLEQLGASKSQQVRAGPPYNFTNRIAMLEISRARELAERLNEGGIPAELRSATDENGLEFAEILVEDHHYDKACDVAEAWAAELAAEVKGNRRCPSVARRNWNKQARSGSVNEIVKRREPKF